MLDKITEGWPTQARSQTCDYPGMGWEGEGCSIPVETNQDRVQLHLSFSALVQESQPPVGFEPTTSRLLSGCFAN